MDIYLYCVHVLVCVFVITFQVANQWNERRQAAGPQTTLYIIMDEPVKVAEAEAIEVGQSNYRWI